MCDFSVLYYLRRLPVLGLAAALITGCASGLSKDECRLADWHAIGYEDGVRGLPDSRLGKHRKACSEHGVAMNFDNYRKGWDEGVNRYCQSSNGYHQGRNGSEYTGVCPPSLETDFLDAYHQGHQLYRLEDEVRRITRTLQSKKNRIRRIEVEIRDTGVLLVSPDIPTEQRVVLLDELRILAEERATIEDEIPLLEDELAVKKRRLSALQTMAVY